MIQTTHETLTESTLYWPNRPYKLFLYCKQLWAHWHEVRTTITIKRSLCEFRLPSNRIIFIVRHLSKMQTYYCLMFKKCNICREWLAIVQRSSNQENIIVTRPFKRALTLRRSNGVAVDDKLQCKHSMAEYWSNYYTRAYVGLSDFDITLTVSFVLQLKITYLSFRRHQICCADNSASNSICPINWNTRVNVQARWFYMGEKYGRKMCDWL